MQSLFQSYVNCIDLFGSQVGICNISTVVNHVNIIKKWCCVKAGMKGRFQSFIEFAFSVLLETRKSLLYVQLNKITIASLKVFLEGF